jgi:uncharacterized membrane protein YdjX (TVP38/TMEM64 family)
MVNIVPAVAGARFAPFAATTLIGIIPGSFIYTSAGRALASMLARGDVGNDDLTIVQLMMTQLDASSFVALFAGLFFLGGLPMLFRKRLQAMFDTKQD